MWHCLITWSPSTTQNNVSPQLTGYIRKRNKKSAVLLPKHLFHNWLTYLWCSLQKKKQKEYFCFWGPNCLPLADSCLFSRKKRSSGLHRFWIPNFSKPEMFSSTDIGQFNKIAQILGKRAGRVLGWVMKNPHISGDRTSQRLTVITNINWIPHKQAWVR